MKRKVYVRTDGSSEIGLGHVVRCISLAHMLRNNFDIHFYSRELPKALKSEIKEEGWDITVLDQESDFLSSLTGNEIIVLDGYQFDSEYQKKVKNLGAKLVYIDDFHNQHFYADLVINHAPGVRKGDYNGESYTKYLLGPDYALIRPEFLIKDNINTRTTSERVKNIFICFGGADIKNLTAKVLSWLPPKNEYNVVAIVGPSFEGRNELKNIIDNRKDLSVSVKSSLTAKEMREEMLNADIGIVPASGVLFEIIASRIPALSGYYVDNQYNIYQGFKELDVFVDVMSFEQERITKALKSISDQRRFELIANQERIIDHKSPQRIFNEFVKLAA